MSEETQPTQNQKKVRRQILVGGTGLSTAAIAFMFSWFVTKSELAEFKSAAKEKMADMQESNQRQWEIISKQGHDIDNLKGIIYMMTFNGAFSPVNLYTNAPLPYGWSSVSNAVEISR